MDGISQSSPQGAHRPRCSGADAKKEHAVKALLANPLFWLGFAGGVLISVVLYLALR
jgi:hypothetical protein